jgi:hypothetical protein
MRYCVRALRSMTALEDELLSQDLCDQGAIGQLLGNLGRAGRQTGWEADRLGGRQAGRQTG